MPCAFISTCSHAIHGPGLTWMCSIQWCTGDNDTMWRCLSWRKVNSASDWER